MRAALFDLRGKVAIITGSSRGLDLASAKGMAEHGAKVAISSRKADACEAAVEEVRAASGETIAVPCNIGRKEELQRLVDTTLATWGRVDIVMANAAIHPWVGSAADMQLVRNMANEFASRGVTANCIAPGTFKTDMARSQWEDPAMVAWYGSRNPSKRFGDVQEIAGVAVLLASPSGGYINGQTIAVDGGHTISFR